MYFSDSLRFTANRQLLAHLAQPDALISQKLAQFTLISLVCISILAPFLLVSPSLPAFRLEILLLPVIFVFYGWFLLAGYVGLIRFNGMMVVSTAYALCVLISTTYGAALLGQTLAPQDFYEFPKLFLPVAFFTLAYEVNLSETGLRRLLLAFGGSLLLICVYAWGQWANLGFLQGLNDIYTAGKHVDDALVYAGRVYSTMGNPNVLGELLAWAIAAFLLAFLGRVVKRTFAMLVALSVLITLGMTGSRYGLLNAALAACLVIFMPQAGPQRRRSALSFLLVLLPIFAGAIFLVGVSNPRILERYQTLKNPAATDSTTERFEKLWLDALDDVAESPLVGRGPAKTTFAGIITDSEYLDVLKEFGVLGFLAYLAYYLFPLSLVWRGMRSGKAGGPALEGLMPANYLVMRLGFVMILTALIMNIGMSTFYNQLLQGFLWMWMGLSARAARNIHEAGSSLPYALQQTLLAAGGNQSSWGDLMSRMRQHRRIAERGMTLLELIIAASILLILASAALPVVRIMIVRPKEAELRRDLREMRNAIDKYKDASDRTLIRTEVGSEGYPPDLETLVKGVQYSASDMNKLRFLRRIPVDPMTGKAEWSLQSVQDEPDATTQGGNNVYDVHSKSEGIALDGTRYKDW